jgi:hypothetical protein
MTAAEALAHPFLAAYSSPEDEPDHPRLFDFRFEATQAIPDVKRLVVQEVESWNRVQAGGPADKDKDSPPPSPRRLAPTPVVDDKIPNIPRFQDQEVPANQPADIEAELILLNI